MGEGDCRTCHGLSRQAGLVYARCLVGKQRYSLVIGHECVGQRVMLIRQR